MGLNFESMKFEEYREWLSVLVLLAGTLFVWWLVVRTARRARHHYESVMAQAMQSPDSRSTLAVSQRRLTALRLVTNAARYVLAAAIMLILLQRLGVKLDSLVLPAGFLAAAIGFGAQNLVRDIVAGLFIVFEGLFAVGDVVSINGVLGEVEEVGLRVTHLRDDNAQLHFFPNGAITTISKYPRRHVPLVLLVPLADSTQRAAALPVVRTAVREFESRYEALSTFSSDLSENCEEVVDAALLDNNPSTTNNGSTTPALQLRLSARPQRVSRVREKLPAIVSAALTAADIKIQAGAEIEAITASA